MIDSPRILVVDDSPSVRLFLSKRLEHMDARVTQAEDGRQGLEMACSKSFDLVITDVEMPHMDGFALCEALKRNPGTRRVPVILLSSLYSDGNIEKGFKAGAAAYVSKADAKGHLHDTIHRVLGEFSFRRSRRILVVDDSHTVRSLLKKALEKSGFQVLTAEDGRQAFHLIEQEPPDLILSDIELPEMDGVGLCKALHADPELASIPFVIMSSDNSRAIMRRMLEWGASAYLVKPFDMEQVVILVEKLLSDHFLLLLKEKERLDTERKLILGSITSLIAALEARDRYTRGHSESVALIVSEMAARMQTSKEDIDSLGMAGRLHDLGKIGVPDSILLKPGPLTKGEFLILKEHPVTGANILGSIPSIHFLVPVILHHHERFDGKGYPHGLRGENIPLWARITAVADTYHALISDRPYRKGMSQGKALEIIEDVREAQLCPQCVDVFLEMMTRASVRPLSDRARKKHHDLPDPRR